MRLEAGTLVWPADLIGTKGFELAWGLHLVLAGWVVWLGTGCRWSRLTKGTAALGALLLGAVVASFSPALVANLYGLLPAALRPLVPAATLSITLIAAATRWRAEIEGLGRSRRIALALIVTSAALAAVTYLVPTEHGTVGAQWSEALTSTFGTGATGVIRRAALTELILTSLPALLLAFGAWRALRTRGTGLASTVWLLVLTPAVLTTLGLKGAAAFGHDGHAVLGIEGALLVGGCSLVGAASLFAILTHLIDPVGVDSYPPTRLLRDQLLYEALRTSREGPPDLRANLAGFRPRMLQLVHARFSTLFSEVAQEHSHLAPYPVIRDDMLRRLWGDDARQPPPAHSPPASRTARWFAKGRRIEQAAALTALLFITAILLWRRADIPVAPPWPLDEPNPWATQLFRDALPQMGIAAGRAPGAVWTS